MRASAQCLATVWRLRECFTSFRRKDTEGGSQNLKFSSPIKQTIWLTIFKETFQKKAIVIKACKQHMKNWHFQMNHTLFFLSIQSYFLASHSLLVTLCLPQLDGMKFCILWDCKVKWHPITNHSFLFWIPLKAYTFVLGRTGARYLW